MGGYGIAHHVARTWWYERVSGLCTHLLFVAERTPTDTYIVYKSKQERTHTYFSFFTLPPYHRTVVPPYVLLQQQARSVLSIFTLTSSRSNSMVTTVAPTPTNMVPPHIKNINHPQKSTHFWQLKKGIALIASSTQ
jgi:hypothetical protein